MSGPVTPEPIMQTALGFLAAQQLFSANDAGIFEHLADSPATLEELADRTGTPTRPTRVVADAMVAVGLLEKERGTYRNTQEAATFLSGQTPADLRPVLRLMELEYRQMTGYSEVIRTGDSSQKPFSLHDFPEVYSEGIEALSAGPAQALPEVYDFSQHRRVLDLGGGTGIFLSSVLAAYPELEGTLFDLPRVTALARDRLPGRPGADRMKIVEGDFLEDPIPQDHDAILMANILHNFPPARCSEILQRVRQAGADDARLLLIEPWTNSARTEPVMAPLLSALLFLESEGEVYSVEQGRRWLEETGWRVLQHETVTGPFTVLTAEVAEG